MGAMCRTPLRFPLSVLLSLALLQPFVFLLTIDDPREKTEVVSNNLAAEALALNPLSHRFNRLVWRAKVRAFHYSRDAHPIPELRLFAFVKARLFIICVSGWISFQFGHWIPLIPHSMVNADSWMQWPIFRGGAAWTAVSIAVAGMKQSKFKFDQWRVERSLQKYPRPKDLISIARQRGITGENLLQFLKNQNNIETTFDVLKDRGLVPDVLKSQRVAQLYFLRKLFYELTLPPAWKASPLLALVSIDGPLIATEGRRFHLAGVTHGLEVWPLDYGKVRKLIRVVVRRGYALFSEQRLQELYGFDYGIESQDHRFLEEGSGQVEELMAAGGLIRVVHRYVEIIIDIPRLMAISLWLQMTGQSITKKAAWFHSTIPRYMRTKEEEEYIKRNWEMALDAWWNSERIPDTVLLHGAAHTPGIYLALQDLVSRRLKKAA